MFCFYLLAEILIPTLKMTKILRCLCARVGVPWWLTKHRRQHEGHLKIFIIIASNWKFEIHPNSVCCKIAKIQYDGRIDLKDWFKISKFNLNISHSDGLIWFPTASQNLRLNFEYYELCDNYGTLFCPFFLFFFFLKKLMDSESVRK